MRFVIAIGAALLTISIAVAVIALIRALAVRRISRVTQQFLDKRPRARPFVVARSRVPEEEPFRCPCGGSQFMEGPHGGLAINFCCKRCGARFNDTIISIDSVEAEGTERGWFLDNNFQPRTNRQSF